MPIKACGHLIFNIIFHAYFNPGNPFLKFHRIILHNNSVIHYGGLIDYITFYALLAICRPYNGGMFQTITVIICIKNIGPLLSDSVSLMVENFGNNVNMAFKFPFRFIQCNFSIIYTYNHHKNILYMNT